MPNLNPFEFTIYSFLERNPERRFTQSEIAEKCKINIRTVNKYIPKLVKKHKLIKSEKDRKNYVFYYDPNNLVTN